MFYPKIETLYNRDDKWKVTNELRREEFGLVKEWMITETARQIKAQDFYSEEPQ